MYRTIFSSLVSVGALVAAAVVVSMVGIDNYKNNFFFLD
jgi:hypothetical protein